ncbi:MAG: thiamine pyrophosphate-binding protein [Desulfarculaceae bacterium]
MTGAEALVTMLRNYGVEYVFGVPGDTSLTLYEALYEANSSITHIMARDERSAGFMADAYARLSHRPGVAECPSGAGALYSVPGVAEANASSIPVIIFTNGISMAGEGKGTITELDHHILFESITKRSSFLKLGKKLPEDVRRAFRIATTGRPGAVHLVLPIENMKGDFDFQPEDLWAEKECMTYPAYRVQAGSKTLDKVAEELLETRKPVMVVGGGVNHSQANNEVISLAQWLQAPVVTTISGQGIMPDDHPLALGVIGDNGYHPHAIQAVENADLLLYLGCKMGSVSTIKWTIPSARPDLKIIQIDIDPTILGNNFENHINVAGDVRLVLSELLFRLKAKANPRESRPFIEELNEMRTKFWQEAQPELNSDGVPLKPQRIINSLNQHLPTPAVVIADAGTPTPYITRFLKLGHASSRFLFPRAYGGLGYAIPAVVGAWLARPDARPVGLFGDGSLGMSTGELETLVRLKVPAVLIHFNNSCFGWIKALQALHCQSKFLSVDFQAGDMSKVASAFGMQAEHIETEDDLEAGMDRAFAAQEPYFLDVVSEAETEQLPPVYSWLKAAGMSTAC